MELIRRFDDLAYLAALESWLWLDGLTDLSPALATVLGDVFLQGGDGAFWFLDTIDGSLERVWPDAAALQAAVNTPEGRQEILAVGLVQAAADAGLAPGQQEVLAFTVPPVMGGELTAENLEVADFVVTVNLLGQIHDQVRSLPEGAEISDVRLR